MTREKHDVVAGIRRVMLNPKKDPAIAERMAQMIELRAAAPIRARFEQADMAETPLFGQGELI